MEDRRARTLLEDELDRLNADAEAHAQERAKWIVSGRGAGGMGAADSGARLVGSMDSDRATGMLRRRREQLLAALDRLDAGRYGRCVVCGGEIGDERLEERPESERCEAHPEGPGDPGSVRP